jgi:hypothetical protein
MPFQDESANPVLQNRRIEVHRQSDLHVRYPHVRQELRHVHRLDSGDRLDFNDYGAFDD